ncbi:4-(cytidine 5'-diphospho)-2-C-methyl-D-erythritol kinase [uncultured Roseobacter sp.]|uniref:4-(cytidine 5'-diphospho)-2-C-methyl-D-erythritol kinase n=1 Tax=uncultured Roseobacter sp. TaxID=114847 RepID=UPI00260D5254|nr:4-(cytidine 5'-diphospho)-2-C-methyl-D-erythritol kinase [uncultured Roseobacter sp.]
MPQTDAAVRAAFAPAKINLALHVTCQRADGYHALDSLVVFADIGDHLQLTPGDALTLAVSGPFATGVPTDARNLALQAAHLAEWRGHITLDKHLPHGGGIGGGSSDAGAILRALGFTGDALPLGADVPVCQFGRAAWMSGVGDDIRPAPQVPNFAAVLVNPRVHVSTPQVFRRLAHKDNPPLQPPPAPGSEAVAWLEWLAAQRNDLEDAAQRIAPAITDVLGAIRQTADVRLSRMSGSGATCFGLYPSASAAQAAAEALTARRPDWWVRATELS